MNRFHPYICLLKSFVIIDINHIPQSFTVEHLTQKELTQINFIFTAGTSHPEWNGYYRELRITVYTKTTEWICEVLKHGIAQAIHRWPRANVSVEELKTLIGCACYYIDSFANQNQ